MTRDQVIREFHRLCSIVNEAETLGLLDAEHAQNMRDRYRERADAVIDYHRKAEKVRT